MAYFSATGTTRSVAETIARVLGADLFEIVPETPYTQADLNYSGDCRANDKQRDESARPAIAADCAVDRWGAGASPAGRTVKRSWGGRRCRPYIRRGRWNRSRCLFAGRPISQSWRTTPPRRPFWSCWRKNGGSVTISARDYGNFEKVEELLEALPRNDKPIDAAAGDLILYWGSSVVLYYETNYWTFTRLGRLEGDLSRLKEQLGEGDVEITYALR